LGGSHLDGCHVDGSQPPGCHVMHVIVICYCPFFVLLSLFFEWKMFGSGSSIGSGSSTGSGSNTGIGSITGRAARSNLNKYAYNNA